LVHRFATPAAAAVLFLLSWIWLAVSLPSNGETPNFDIVFSPPSRLAPGDTPEIALYAVRRTPPVPVTGLGLELWVRPAGHREAKPQRFSTTEKRPGQYVASVKLPETLNDDPLEIAVYRSAECRQPIAVFPVTVSRPVAVAAVPPARHVRAGGSGAFRLAAIDPVTTQGLPRVPIRCRITTPDGFRTTSRPVFTSFDGTTEFPFRLHRHSPPGEYLFEFSSGRRSLLFRLPVSPALPGVAALRELAANLGPALPVPVRALLRATVPSSVAAEAWRLRLPRQPRSALRWVRVKGRTIRAGFAIEGHRMGVIEVWMRDRLLHSTLCTRATGTVEITFNNPLPRTTPLKVRLWQKKRRQVWSDETVIAPAALTDPAAARFRDLAERCLPAPEPVLSRLFTPLSPPVLIGGATPPPGRLAQVLLLLGETSLLCLPWAFLICLLLPLAGRFLRDQDRAVCIQASRLFLPVTAALLLVFFGVLRHPSLFLEAPAPWIWLALLAGAGAALANAPHHSLADDFRRFVVILQMPVAALVLQSLAGTCLIPDQSIVNLVVLAILAAVMTGITLHRLGHLATALQPADMLVASPSAAIQRAMDLLTGYGWKSAVAAPVLLALLFFGILKLHTHLTPPGSRLAEDRSQRTWKPKNPLPTRGNNLQFVPVRPASDISAVTEPGSELFQIDQPRGIRSRFLLLRGGQAWSGRKIQRITVFTGHREFLDQWIASLRTLRTSLWTICLELGARAVRFRHLEPVARPAERTRIEACLVVLGHMLSREVQMGKTLTRTRRDLLLDTLKALGSCIAIDPALRQAVLALPVVPASLDEQDPVHGLPEHALASSPARLLDAVAPALRPGGSLLIESDTGSRVSFPVRQDTLTLTRGSSFREDFEITRLEAGRDMPLLLELAFTP